MALNKGWKDFQATKYTAFYKGGKIFKADPWHKNISCSIRERPQKRKRRKDFQGKGGNFFV